MITKSAPTDGNRAALSPELLARRVSIALVIVAAIAGSVSFFFWGLFNRDVPAGIGNLRGTALTMLLIALPLLVASMYFSARGSLRAQLLWLGCSAYVAYNAVLFCFAAHFNSLFLLYTTLLALSFWALVTQLRALDLEVVRAATTRVPARAIAIYLLACTVAFASLWLVSLVPATINNSMPPVIVASGLTQNAVWVLDFAFTFPLMFVGALWLLKRRPWGYLVGGMMVIMLTIESASIAIDQVFGHLHDPSASMSAVPIMLLATVAGLVFTALFLNSLTAPALDAHDSAARPRMRAPGVRDPSMQRRHVSRTIQ